MAKWVDEGENRVVDILFGTQAVDATLYLGLYTDATEPGESDAISDCTEPSGGGYARIALSRGSWVITNDYAQYAQQTFECGSGGDWGSVYGYFIATSVDDSGKLLCVEDFSNGPYAIAAGDSIKVTAKITCS